MDQPLSVDQKRCVECGACSAECVCHWSAPDGYLAASSSKHVDHSSPYCTRCLHCYAVCPAGAIQLSDEYTALVQTEAWREVGPEALESLLAVRRSTRRFQPLPVPRDLIEQVVAAGRHVPSGGSRHPYEFTVLTDPEVKQALLTEFSHYYGRIRKLMGSAILLRLAGLALGRYERAFLSDPDYGQRMKGLLNRFREGEDPVFYGAPAVIVVHTRELIPTPHEDSILAGFAMVLMAQTLGLGTCFVSLAHKGLNASKRAKALVGMAPSDQVHAVILLGYPDVTYRRPAPRPAKAVRWICTGTKGK